jgi:hypothetical protein
MLRLHSQNPQPSARLQPFLDVTYPLSAFSAFSSLHSQSVLFILFIRNRHIYFGCFPEILRLYHLHPPKIGIIKQLGKARIVFQISQQCIIFLPHNASSSFSAGNTFNSTVPAFFLFFVLSSFLSSQRKTAETLLNLRNTEIEIL